MIGSSPSLSSVPSPPAPDPPRARCHRRRTLLAPHIPALAPVRRPSASAPPSSGRRAVAYVVCLCASRAITRSTCAAEPTGTRPPRVAQALLPPATSSREGAPLSRCRGQRPLLGVHPLYRLSIRLVGPPSPRGSPALVRVCVSRCIRKSRVRLPGGPHPGARPPRVPPAPLAAPEAPPVSRARPLARPSLVAQSVGLGTRPHSSSSSTSCSSTSRCAFPSSRSRVRRSSSRGTAGRASGFAGAAVASGLVRRASTGATSTEAPAS